MESLERFHCSTRFLSDKADWELFVYEGDNVKGLERKSI